MFKRTTVFPCVRVDKYVKKSQEGSDRAERPNADSLLSLPEFACCHTFQMPGSTCIALSAGCVSLESVHSRRMICF